VILNWNAPVDNGKSLTSYKIVIRTVDLEYVEEKTICDGENFSVIQNTQCIVTLESLRSSPFNLLIGNSIYLAVSATNDYGTSEFSEIGNGGVIVLVPDAPKDLVNVPSVTNDQTIGFAWSDGDSNGLETILDYRVWYD
jgi:hypothetical protein